MTKTKDQINGAVPIIDTEIEVTHENGTKLYFVPLSAWHQLAIFAAVEEALPYPDPLPFELPLPNAAVEGDRMPATENPDYQQQCQEIELLRRRERVRRLVYAALHRTDPDREILINRYHDLVARLRAVGINESDDWKLTVEAVFFTDPSFLNQIIAVCQGEAELTEGEVLDHVRLFRLSI